MIDFSKMYCKSHPYQVITNFCTKEDCLVGLCATCICSHTQTHLHSNTSPQYQNIRSTFTQMHQKVRDAIQTLQADKQRVSMLVRKIDIRKKNLHQQITKAKIQCTEVIDRYFQEFEKQVENQIMSQTMKMNLHSPYRLETLNVNIAKQIQNLISNAQDLNSSNFLECLKRVKMEILPLALTFHKQTLNQITKNQNFGYQLEYKKELFDEMNIILRKMCQIKFVQFKIQTNNKKQILIEKSQNQIVKNNSQMIGDLNRINHFQRPQSSKSIRYQNQNQFLAQPNTHFSQNRGCSLKFKKQSQFINSNLNASINRIIPQCNQQSQFIQKPINNHIYQFYSRPHNYQQSIIISTNPMIQYQQSSNKSSNICIKNSQIKQNHSIFKNCPQFIMKNNNNKINFIPQYVDLNTIKNTFQPLKKTDSKKGIKLYQNQNNYQWKDNNSIASSVNLT